MCVCVVLYFIVYGWDSALGVVEQMKRLQLRNKGSSL